MSKINQVYVNEGVVIDAPVSKAYELVKDFSKRSLWDPWLLYAPDYQPDLSSTDTGVPVSDKDTDKDTDKEIIYNKLYWDNPLLGSGEQIITNIVKNKSISIDLNFFKPYKSKCKVEFLFEQLSSDQTRVSWTMENRLNILLFFLKKSMESLISESYIFGLSRLKRLVENDSVGYQLDYEKESDETFSLRVLSTEYKNEKHQVSQSTTLQSVQETCKGRALPEKDLFICYITFSSGIMVTAGQLISQYRNDKKNSDKSSENDSESSSENNSEQYDLPTATDSSSAPDTVHDDIPKELVGRYTRSTLTLDAPESVETDDLPMALQSYSLAAENILNKHMSRKIEYHNTIEIYRYDDEGRLQSIDLYRKFGR